MIRLIQRRLIIPRGDTGSFSIPVLKNSTDNIAVFTIFDEVTHTKMFQKMVPSEGDVITIAFTHSDTVNLKPGKYVWDIKYYSNPEYIDDELVNGEEIDSYYAGFSLPVCEIRETADNYLVSPEAPTATLSPEQLEIVTGAIHSLNEAIRKTQENVEHYPEIRDEVWYVWDAELGDYVSTGVRANGIVGNGIASAVLNNDYTLTLNFTDGTSFTSPSIRGQRGNGIDDIVLNNDFTLTISYTDGDSYVTPSIRGPVGATPQFSIGTVQDGAVAAANITGTAENPVLNLTLPNAHVPTRVSQLENDAGYLTEHQDLSDYVQKTDYATSNEAGVVKVSNTGAAGLAMQNGELKLFLAQGAEIKSGTNNFKPVVPTKQHESTFYGLAKAAGDTTQSQSSNAVGTYTNEAKAAIQQMLDVPSNADIPTQVSKLTNDAGYLTAETDPTVPAWAKAAQKPSYTAAEVGAPTVAEMNTAIGTAIGQINSFDMAVVQALPTQDISTHTIYLVPKTGETNDVYDEYVYINDNWEMVGNTQIDLSDYALKSELPTKVSDLTDDSGHYTKPSTGIPASDLANGVIPNVPVQDVKINNTSILNNNIANIPIASKTKPGVIGIDPDFSSFYIWHNPITNIDILSFNAASSELIKGGSNPLKVNAVNKQHEAVFYGLAKAAGSDEDKSPLSVGQYTDEAKAAIQQMLDVPSTSDIPEVPVQDVQVNGTSILDAQGVANINKADNVSPGVIIVGTGLSIGSTGILRPNGGSANDRKSGTNNYIPTVMSTQHESAFYGLAKAAGADMKDIANTTVGTYPDAQKEAIQSMLGISQMLAPTNPNLVATQAYSIGDVFAANGHLYKATAAIAQDGAIIPDTNCVETTMVDESVRDVQVNGTSIVNNGVANIPIADRDTAGVIKIGNGLTIDTSTKKVSVVSAAADAIKNGSSGVHFLNPSRQHISTFYGLSKVAGVDLANETVTLGTYPETSKSAIRTMIGAASSNVIAVQDTQPTDTDTKIWLPETAETPIQVPTVAEMNAALAEKVDDVQVNGTSIITNGIASVPLIGYNRLGVAKLGANSNVNGLATDSTSVIYIDRATSALVKGGANRFRPIAPDTQHESTFYGLSKVAGVDLANETVTLGTYPETSKTAIKTMLGVQDGLEVVRLI